VGTGEAHGAGIDITPEMLQAGEWAIRDFLDGHSDHWAISQQVDVLAKAVFLAMASKLPAPGSAIWKENLQERSNRG